MPQTESGPRTLIERLQVQAGQGEAILAGFDFPIGPGPQSEDRFDALVGWLGPLNELLELHPRYEPGDFGLRRVEGWSFGQKLSDSLIRCKKL